MSQLLEFGGAYYTPTIFRLLWEKLRDKYASENFKYGEKEYQFRRISGSTPSFPTEPNTITLIGIRNNEEISFNDTLTYNDDLIVYENTSSGEVRLWRFPCTTDPKSKKDNIGHLIKGVWASYIVGNHRHQPGRTALRQDANTVVVARTNKNGEISKVERGHFGTNIHNKNGFFNSSLGCTILENDINYDQKFKPILKRVKDQTTITYILTDRVDVSAVLGLINVESIKPRPIEIIQSENKKEKILFV